MIEDIYLFCCPECGSNIEIESAKMELITFLCPNCEKFKNKTTMPIEKFLRSIDKFNSIKCSKCHISEKEEKNLKYCSTHKLILCPKCADIHLKENANKEKKCNLIDNYKENWDKCSIHPNQNNSCFCETCKVHLCPKCLKDQKIREKHKNHEKRRFDDDLQIENTEEFSENIETLKKAKKEKEDFLFRDFQKKCENEIENLKNKKENDKKVNNNNLQSQLNDINIKSDEEIKKIKEQIEELKKQIQNKEKDRKEREEVITKFYIDKNNDLENNYKKKEEQMKKRQEEEKQKLLQDNNEIKKINNTLELSNLIKNTYEKYQENYYYNRNYAKISEYLKEVKNDLDNPNNNINNISNFSNYSNMNIDKSIFNNISSIKTICSIPIDNNNIVTPFDNLKNSEIVKKTNNEDYTIDNTFTIVNLPNVDNYYIIYAGGAIGEKRGEYSILCQNIFKNETIKIGEHEEKITGFRNIYDEKNKRILLMSLSGEDNNVKLWETKDFKNWNQLLDLQNVNEQTEILSGCFINYKNNIYLLTSGKNQENDQTIKDPEPIKVYDLEGNEIEDKKIPIKSNVNFIDTFYHEKRDKYYVLLGCGKTCKYYNYEDQNDHQSFYDYDQGYVKSVIIDESRDLIIALGLEQRTIMGWEFKSNGALKFKIYFKDIASIGTSLCLWNSQYLFVGLGKNVGIIDLSPLDKNEENEEKSQKKERSRFKDDDEDEENKKSEIEVIKILPCDNDIKTIKKMENKIYIVSQTSDGKILLWK